MVVKTADRLPATGTESDGLSSAGGAPVDIGNRIPARTVINEMAVPTYEGDVPRLVRLDAGLALGVSAGIEGRTVAHHKELRRMPPDLSHRRIGRRVSGQPSLRSASIRPATRSRAEASSTYPGRTQSVGHPRTPRDT